MVIRKEIDGEHPFYLASLLNATDRCANVASVYGAFLKEFKKTALKKLTLQKHETYSHETRFYELEAKEFVKECPRDSILYLDPPYNNRQYGANYFVPSLIAQYPDTLETKGVSGIPLSGYYKSPFCQKKNCQKAFEDLIENSRSNTICLSYNNEGIMTLESLQLLFEDFDSIETYSFDYQRFRSNQRTENHSVVEYFIVAKR